MTWVAETHCRSLADCGRVKVPHGVVLDGIPLMQKGSGNFLAQVTKSQYSKVVKNMAVESDQFKFGSFHSFHELYDYNRKPKFPHLSNGIINIYLLW